VLANSRRSRTFPAVGFAGAIREVACQAIVLGQQRRSRLQDRFGACRVVPKLLRSFDTPVDFLHQRFHQRRDDRQSQPTITRIVHSAFVVLQIGQRFLQRRYRTGSWIADDGPTKTRWSTAQMQHPWRAFDRARRLASGARDFGRKLLGVLLQQGLQHALGERLANLKSDILHRRDVRVGFERLALACSPSDNFPPRLCQFEQLFLLVVGNAPGCHRMSLHELMT